MRHCPIPQGIQAETRHFHFMKGIPHWEGDQTEQLPQPLHLSYSKVQSAVNLVSVSLACPIQK